MQNTTWAVIYIPDVDKTVLRLAIVKWAMSESFYVFELAVIILWDNTLTAESRNWWNWWKEPTLCLHWEIIWMLTFVMYFLKCLTFFVAFHSKKKTRRQILLLFQLCRYKNWIAICPRSSQYLSWISVSAMTLESVLLNSTKYDFP